MLVPVFDWRVASRLPSPWNVNYFCLLIVSPAFNWIMHGNVDNTESQCLSQEIYYSLHWPSRIKIGSIFQILLWFPMRFHRTFIKYESNQLSHYGAFLQNSGISWWIQCTIPGPWLSWRSLSAHVPRKGATCSCKKLTVIGKHFYKSLQYNQWSAKRNSWSTCFQNAILIL